MTSDAEAASESRRKIAVIGAGITGLAAAQRLISLDQHVQVTLFEASDRPGGIFRTETIEDFLVELGPDSFITNKPGAIQLCRDIGFLDQLISTDETFRRSLVLRKGRPLPVPDGFMLMAPAKPWAILTTKILSVSGKLRLLREAFVSRKTGDEDETLASFVRRRFGKETLDRLVQPLVGGIYTSDPEKLSLKATLPRFLDMEQRHGSVIRATLAEQRTKSVRETSSAGSGARYGLFMTPTGGLSTLVDALVQHLNTSGRINWRLSTGINSVSAVNADSQRRTITTSDGESSNYDSVICALPAHRAADVLHDDSAMELAKRLREIEYASSAVVVSGHEISDFTHPLNAFGLVIPHIEGRRILAVSFSSRKFPGRAPAGKILLRTFVGGAMQPELLQHTDDELTDIVNEELREMLGMRQPPQFSRVARYTNAMPQYHVGHLKLIDDIDALLKSQRGLQLAGSAYRGVGIPDSISSGRTAAAQCLGTRSADANS